MKIDTIYYDRCITTLENAYDAMKDVKLSEVIKLQRDDTEE